MTTVVRLDEEHEIGWSFRQVEVPSNGTFPRWESAGCDVWIAQLGRWRIDAHGRDFEHAALRLLQRLVGWAV